MSTNSDNTTLLGIPNPSHPPAPTNEAVPPAKDGVESVEEAVEDEDPAAVSIDPESPFAPFQELRQQMMNKGVDFAEMDSLVASGEPLKDEHINLIAQHGGYPPEAVKAHMKLAYDYQKSQEKAKKLDEQEAQVFLNEVNTLAGGDYKVLIDWIAANTAQEKIEIWNTALASKNPKVQKSVIKEMQEYRLSKTPTNPTPPGKQADLGLLTKANSTNRAVTPPVDPKEVLAKNPLAGASLQTLCAIKLDAKSPHREAALQVLQVKYPDLA